MADNAPSDDFLKASKALVHSRTSQGIGIGVTAGVGLTLFGAFMVATGGDHIPMANMLTAMAFMGGTGAALGGGIGFATGNAVRANIIMKELNAPRAVPLLPPPAPAPEPPAPPLI